MFSQNSAVIVQLRGSVCHHDACMWLRSWDGEKERLNEMHWLNIVCTSSVSFFLCLFLQPAAAASIHIS